MSEWNIYHCGYCQIDFSVSQHTDMGFNPCPNCETTEDVMYMDKELWPFDSIEIGLIKDKKVLMWDTPEDVRERIEEMIYKKIGFCPSLQEAVYEGEYKVYLHTEAFNELNEDQLEQIIQLQITDDPEQATKAIKDFLQIDFQVV